MTFTIKELPQQLQQSMIDKNVWYKSCPVQLEKLKLISVEYFDFSGKVKEGCMVVHTVIAKAVVGIFKELADLKFPIAKMSTIDRYEGDDDRSMKDNNSSCFNYRKIANSSELSMHSYGLAIDINPLQNPYIVIDPINHSISVHPKQGVSFLNRHNQRPGMVEPIVHIFKKYGFDVWGGEWNTPIDYHHFQTNRDLAKRLHLFH
ncbi:MAG: M15 family peptidase [Rickettsiaceae bacterium]|nr:MAG: M15 family peptidase [Rickettsiaceae bacterium]